MKKKNQIKPSDAITVEEAREAMGPTHYFVLVMHVFRKSDDIFVSCSADVPDPVFDEEGVIKRNAAYQEHLREWLTSLDTLSELEIESLILTDATPAKISSIRGIDSYKLYRCPLGDGKRNVIWDRPIGHRIASPNYKWRKAQKEVISLLKLKDKKLKPLKEAPRGEKEPVMYINPSKKKPSKGNLKKVKASENRKKKNKGWVSDIVQSYL